MRINQPSKRFDMPVKLPAEQVRIRDRCGGLPKRMKRSIDDFRIARGLLPLWARRRRVR